MRSFKLKENLSYTDKNAAKLQEVFSARAEHVHEHVHELIFYFTFQIWLLIVSLTELFSVGLQSDRCRPEDGLGMCMGVCVGTGDLLMSFSGCQFECGDDETTRNSSLLGINLK